MKTRKNFAELIAAFRKRKVLVIGDLMLDRFIFGKVSRISPEAPVPVVDVLSEKYMLGGAANVANNISFLGGKAVVLGICGTDPAGNVLRELLGNSGIETVLVEDSRPTSIKTRVIAHSQQVVRFDMESKDYLNAKALKGMLSLIDGHVRSCDAVIISDYKKGVVSDKLMRHLARKMKGKFMAVDPKVGHFHLYKGTSLITPNVLEASEGSSVNIKDGPSLLKAGNTLLKRLRTDAVLITRGEEGMSLFTPKGVTHIPTVAKQVFDVTGAGDTVIAAFTMAYACGASMIDAAVIANHAAGLVVAQVGTAAATPEELIRSLGENGFSGPEKSKKSGKSGKAEKSKKPGRP